MAREYRFNTNRESNGSRGRGAGCNRANHIDPKKALSDYASAVDGKFSWGQTSEAEHLASKGKHATNDPAESPFAQLTRQLQCFGRVVGVHASAIGQARINGDFKRDLKDSSKDGAYFKLSPDERQSLLAYALCASPAVRQEEKVNNFYAIRRFSLARESMMTS